MPESPDNAGIMTFPRIILAGFALLATVAAFVPAVAQTASRTAFKIVALDPGPNSTLGTNDRLYLRISYESPVPVRFAAKAIRQGAEQGEAYTSSTPPYAAGLGEALVWLGFPTPIRIDEIRVTAYDMEWQELGTLTNAVVATWESREDGQPRATAEWVGPLLKQHRHAFDTAFDPQPQQPAPLFDIFFLISVLAMPVYLALQLRMLVRYRGRWQWYAAAPLLPFVPMGLYSVFGLGLSSSLWVIFLFRYMTVALLYLLILWVVKWANERAEQVKPTDLPNP